MIDDRVILLGEAPGEAYDPNCSSPLFPFPDKSAGGRLRRLTGLSRQGYLEQTIRMNVVPYYPGKTWPRDAARAQAVQLIRGRLLHGRRIILVGSRVRDAFFSSGTGRSKEVCRWHDLAYGMRVALVPHPSGRNLWYNDPDNRSLVENFFRETFHAD